jgi:hypothetical protein
MFRALLAHPQVALHKRHLVYCVRIMSVVCGTVHHVGFIILIYYDARSAKHLVYLSTFLNSVG